MRSQGQSLRGKKVGTPTVENPLSVSVLFGLMLDHERQTDMKQVAALPYDLAPDGQLKVMLITSRRTRRWVIPKGNPMKGVKAHRAAEQEAFEEAGLIGITSNRAVGTFWYKKQKSNQTQADVEVTVFPMLVTGQAGDWPERRQRERRWLDRFAASQMADDVGLSRLILAFDPSWSS